MVIKSCEWQIQSVVGHDNELTTAAPNNNYESYESSICLIFTEKNDNAMVVIQFDKNRQTESFQEHLVMSIRKSYIASNSISMFDICFCNAWLFANYFRPKLQNA